MEVVSSITDQVKMEVEQIFQSQGFEKRYFHSLKHTEDVVEAIQQLGEAYELNADDMEILIIAAWFHDTGYENGGAEEHEERGVEKAKAFLNSINYPKEKVEEIAALILATKKYANPATFHEELLRDADMSHMGRKKYLAKCGQLRSEWEADGIMMTEAEWLKMNLDFITSHSYHTAVAKELYDTRKLKNISKVEKMYKERLSYDASAQEIAEKLEEGQENPYEDGPKPSRGIETMYRVALRNHNQLSKIADNKANILLSINALMISIVISSLASKLDTNTALIIPTVILLLVSMISIVFATLATRPKITSANFNREKFLSNKVNILFFGNFYKMNLNEFEWGMDKLMHNERLLYGSLSKDLYFLGLVLAKKYKLLRTGYNFFMFGMIAAALAFISAFIYMRTSGSF